MQLIGAEPEDLSGHVLGGAYRIETRLDEGGMGTVYLAQHLRLKRAVAVKIMATHLAGQAAALERFSREAEMISQLTHPHIVQVLDFNTTEDGRPYLVMELLKGRPLSQVLEQHGRLDLRAALRIAIQTAAGLAAAHEAGIVHRDLKPANIFLTDAGDQLFAKLLDFGISKRVGAHAATMKLTGEFDVLGTPDYMPPEQAAGQTAQVDHRGDQYALAAIVYEMLVGQVPFVAEDVMRLLQKVIRDQPAAPSTLRADIPASVDEAILRALAKAPDARFASVADFSEVLEFALAQIRASSPHLRSSTPRSSLLAPAPNAAPGSDQRVASRHSSAPTPPAQNVERFGSDSPEAPTGRQRTSWHSKDPVKAVRDLLVRTRQELGFDNLELAISCAESALEIARMTEDPEVKALLAAHTTLLDRTFLRKLGSLNARISVRTAQVDSVNLSPEQAFLMSRLDGASTVEEALDLSPLPRPQTLGHLVSLQRAGHLSVRP